MINSVLTAPQIIRYVKSLLDEKPILKDIMIKGEISNVAHKWASGHLYFSIGDQTATVRCVMFSRYASTLKEIPQNGTAMLVRGSLNIYEKDGVMQLIAYELQAMGTGQRKNDLEAIKKKMQQEGLFSLERKRSFVPFPQTVGVVTSSTGAAIKDILATFKLTNPMVKIIIYPATVQGVTAPQSVMSAIKKMQQDAVCDCCIIARGGGSSEDLDCFNNEMLARLVADCTIPVISAVGHETDTTLIDLVSDARAATPTASVEIATQPVSQITDRLTFLRSKMYSQMLHQLEAKEQKIENLQLRLKAQSPKAKLEKNKYILLGLTAQLHTKQEQKINNLQAKVVGLIENLEHLNPVQVLKRGYTITTKPDGTIPIKDGFETGQTMITHFQNSKIYSTITAVEEDS